MEIVSLDLQNFMSIGRSRPIALSGKGLVLIQGENDDDSSANSNGVGKSSLADGLSWGLFGKTARGIEGDAVVNKTAKRDCRVSTVLEDGEVCYRVTRHRKDKTHKNATYVTVWDKAAGEAAAKNIEKGTEKETQALINSILGCSLEVFMAAIYAGQEVTPDLPAMTDKNLKLLIEEASGTQRLEKAYELAREEANEASKKLAAAMNQVTSSESNLISINARLLDTERKHQEFEDQRKGKSDEYKIQAQQRVAEIKELQTQIDPGRKEKLEAELGQVNSKIDSIKPMLDQAETLAGLASAASLDERTVARRVTEKTAVAQRVKSNVDNAEEAMKVPCETCGKPHTPDEIESYRAHQTELLKNALRELQTAKTEWDERVTLATEAKSKADAFKATIPDISHLHARSKEIHAELAGIAANANNIASLTRGAAELVEKAKQRMTEPNPYASARDTLIEQVAEQMARIEELKKSVKELEAEFALRESVVAVFSPAGVRAHILDTVTPFLNDRTSEYLATLSDGNITAVWTTLTTTAKGDLKEKFSIEVTNDKGAESFAGLSGGEKRKVRLATMLALQDLVASRATKPINIWIGDEIDDALDSAGLERLMTILEKKARDRGTVLVISHNELRDWVDQVLTVRKVAGVSTVEGEL